MRNQLRNSIASVSGIALATSAIVLGAVNPASAAFFQRLGYLPDGGSYSQATGVSADGSVVVGESDSTSGIQAFRWTPSGMVGLGYLSSGSSSSSALGVSGDGSVVVGGDFEAFRWTQAGGMAGLGYLIVGGSYSAAYGASGDGSVVVGESDSSSGTEAFRWTPSGMVGLGYLSGGGFLSTALGVSADGSVVVGQSDFTGSFEYEAFRWTPSGMVGLGHLIGGGSDSQATGVSADGSVIVGSSNSTSGTQAFRWTPSGMVGLGDLPGGSFDSTALGVSGDGSLVVGYGTSILGKEAFIWDSVKGMRNLQDILVTNFGLDLTGWQLLEATGISADGQMIVGYGLNPDGNQEAWIASISIPEPSNTIALGLVSLFGFVTLRRKG